MQVRAAEDYADRGPLVGDGGETAPEADQSNGQAILGEEVSSMPDAGEIHKMPAAGDDEMQTTVHNEVAEAGGDAPLCSENGADQELRQARKAKKNKKGSGVSDTSPLAKKVKMNRVDYLTICKTHLQESSAAGCKRDSQSILGALQAFQNIVNRQQEQAGRAGRLVAPRADARALLLPLARFKTKLDKVCEGRCHSVTFGKMPRVVLQAAVETLAQAEAMRLQAEAAKRNRKRVMPQDFQGLATVTCDRFNEAGQKNLLDAGLGNPCNPATPVVLQDATPATPAGPAIPFPVTPLPGTPLPATPLPATPLLASAGSAASTAGSGKTIPDEATVPEQAIVKDKDLKKLLQFYNMKFIGKSYTKFGKLREAQIVGLSGWCLDAANARDRSKVELDHVLMALSQEALHQARYAHRAQAS